MTDINQLELQNIRHLVGAHGTVANKLEAYSQQCADPNVQQMLKDDAADAKNSKQQLMNFLG